MEGNALFVKEVIRMLGQEGMEEGQGEIISIPKGIPDVRGRRLSRLSDHCNQALAEASIIVREFDFKVLNAPNREVAEEQLLQLLDEALEAHVIEELPGGVERY